MKNNIIDITNQNRSRHHIWFERIENNLYIIKSEKDWVLKYASCNYDSLPDDAEDYDFCMKNQYDETIKGKYFSFDPDSGPYMEVGSYEIEGNVLERIYEKEGIIYFKTTIK